MNANEYIALDGTEMANLVKTKTVATEELIEASFLQLEKVNPSLNAVIHTRKEQALEEAAATDANAAFAGVPIFLKDQSQPIEGEPSTGGARLFRHAKAQATSNFVRALHRAGFISSGHTATPEFALKNITESKLYGPTRNPWNHRHSPGGSSGGAAALVASGVVPIAGASDGGGSIRIPASFTGLVGLKPTRGRMPVGPGAGRQWHGAAIDFVLSRTVRDSAKVLTEMQTVQQEAAFQTPLFPGRFEEQMKKPFQKRLHVAISTSSPVGTPVSEEAKKAVLNVASWLEEQGHHVEEAEPEIDGVELMRNYYLMNSGEIASLVNQLETTLGKRILSEDVEVETWLLHIAGQNVSAAEFSASLLNWDALAARMAHFHKKYDLYLTPATAYAAPEIGELTHDEEKENQLRAEIERRDPKQQQELIYEMFLPSLSYTPFTQLANLTGQPALSMPVHLTKEKLPLGVQAIAPKGEEHILLKLACQLEETDLWIGMKGNSYFNRR